MSTTASRSRATVTATIARKPLYLFSDVPAHIDAGPDHLVLRRNGMPVQRFPLARIARIICNRNASWSGAALALCLAEGVPVTWLDGRGHALGSTQSCHPHPFPFSTLVETYLELPDWPKRFANWLARRRLETLTACAKRAAECGHGLDPVAFEELKREYVYNGVHPLAFGTEGEGWCHALVVDRLQREGLQACYWGFDATPLELAAELATLLWAELNLDCGTLPASADHGVVLARLFEAWARQREARLLLHLGDLKRHLAREVDAWH
ncbi:MAG: transposase [Betaproteobacteria bacterium]|nr:MAG: transposase [Betaproteobacteria bacterium]